MKYKLLKIDHDNTTWYVSISAVAGDRVAMRPTPNPLGWLYYSVSEMSDAAAFRLLQNCMAKAHRDEIKSKISSLAKLRRLKAPR